MITATSFWTIFCDETWVAHRNQAAVNALASQQISVQEDIEADYVGTESGVHGVFGQTGPNPWWQTSTT